MKRECRATASAPRRTAGMRHDSKYCRAPGLGALVIAKGHSPVCRRLMRLRVLPLLRVRCRLNRTIGQRRGTCGGHGPRSSDCRRDKPSDLLLGELIESPSELEKSRRQSLAD